MRFFFLKSPHKTALRRVLFQVHLWLGLLLALYVVIIGLSGSTLVFQEEIRRASLPHPPFDPGHTATPNRVIECAQHGVHGERLTFISPPQEPTPWWTLYFENERGRTRIVYADAATGQIHPMPHRLWIDWVQDLHIYLLAGHTGFIVNCSMGIAILVVTLTGIVLWWPGLHHWKRGMVISLHRGWKRINYDLHSVVGFWTFGIVLWWGMTAIYFLFPAQVTSLVNHVSPLVGMKPPEVLKTAESSSVASIEEILKSNMVVGHGFVSGIGLPASPGDNITVYIDRKRPGDFSHRYIDTFDGHTGQLVACWHYGENVTLGDWILWLVHPLHFGTLWGLPIKILWVLLGLSLVCLSISGMLMYWNRCLSKLFR